MAKHLWLTLPLAGVFLLPALLAPSLPACCPAPRLGQPVVNADQTVIMIWDAATQTQHFIRQASFKSAADDFGFLVPTPAEPVLEESANDAFPHLQKLTEPDVVKMPRPSGGMGCGCATVNQSFGTKSAPDAEPPVRILQEKLVAGFNAVVLETKSAAALVDWLKKNEYAFSPEVEAWARPYVERGWKITALKVAKGKNDKADKTVSASALRISFKTDRPLFPYREPDPKSAAAALGAQRRLLRIYFLAEARYQGTLTKEVAWTGEVTWANKLKDEDRRKVLELLKLPENTGPATWWLTEFEDHWPYQAAPADLYFSPDPNQSPVERPPIVQYVAAPWPTDVMVYACAMVLVLPPVVRRLRRHPKA